MVKILVDFNKFDIVPKELINIEEYILNENEVTDFLLELSNRDIKPNSIKFIWDVDPEENE